MAIRPCYWCFSRFQGPANTAYVSVLIDGQADKVQPRLCRNCYLDLVDVFTQVNGRINYDEVGPIAPVPCLICHSNVEVGKTYPAFMTGFPAKQEREDFFAPVCADCLPDARARILRA